MNKKIGTIAIVAMMALMAFSVAAEDPSLTSEESTTKTIAIRFPGDDERVYFLALEVTDGYISDIKNAIGVEEKYIKPELREEIPTELDTNKEMKFSNAVDFEPYLEEFFSPEEAEYLATEMMSAYASALGEKTTEQSSGGGVSDGDGGTGIMCYPTGETHTVTFWYGITIDGQGYICHTTITFAGYMCYIYLNGEVVGSFPCWLPVGIETSCTPVGESSGTPEVQAEGEYLFTDVMVSSEMASKMVEGYTEEYSGMQ